MFNIQPGQGLGFTGSREIALGLGDSGDTAIITPIGDGGHYKDSHGNVIVYPTDENFSGRDKNRLALMAILAIREYYD